MPGCRDRRWDRCVGRVLLGLVIGDAGKGMEDAGIKMLAFSISFKARKWECCNNGILSLLFVVEITLWHLGLMLCWF